MRLMAYCRWIGIRCDQCAAHSVSEHGLPVALGAGVWFRHRRSLNRHLCQGCWAALSETQRAEYVRDTPLSGKAASRRATRVSAT